MRIRDAVPLAMVLALAAACGDGGDEPSLQEDATPSVTADEVRESAAPTDTAGGEETGTEGAGDEASGPMARSRALYTVQVGAFVREENASSLRQDLEEAGLPTWTPTAEIEDRDFQRVRIGATSTVAEARRLGQRLQERFDADFWIAPVPPEEDLPSDLVTSTQRLMEGG